MSHKAEIQLFRDEELLQNYLRSKNNTYLGELLQRHIRFAFVVCFKYLRNEEEAKDMVMKVFEKITIDVHRFEIQNFKSWLHTVTKNACLMYLRDAKKHSSIHLENENEMDRIMENSPFLHHEDGNEKELKLVELEQAIEKLEPCQQKCVHLFYLKEKSYKEVVEITGFSMMQVKSHLQNGKRNLKNLLISNKQLTLLIFILIYWDRF